MDDTELQCAEKLAFDTKEAAEGAAVYATYQHGDKFKVYQCKDCNLWHLATK